MASQSQPSTDASFGFRSQLLNLQQHMQSTWQRLDPEAKWHQDNPGLSQPSQRLSHHESQIFYSENGRLFEKAAINFSYIHGQGLPKVSLQSPLPSHTPFISTAISTILHPNNPFIPIAHCNLRFFSTLPTDVTPALWWYAAVMDLNPCYGFTEDCILWHQACKRCCDEADMHYTTYKKACDDYFYLPHRQEHRGIGGLWVEKLNDRSHQACQSFLLSMGHTFVSSYQAIIQKRLPMAYHNSEKAFQNLRRARYAEFNLIHDRGTKFGLEFGGRTESILVSMPPSAHWQYRGSDQAASEAEKKLISCFLTPKDWASLSVTNA